MRRLELAGPRLLAHVLRCAARHVGCGALVCRATGVGVPRHLQRGQEDCLRWIAQRSSVRDGQTSTWWFAEYHHVAPL